jgi:hypothetical protein
MRKLRLTRKVAITSVVAVGAAIAFMLPAAAAVSVQSQSPADAVIAIKPNAVRKINGAYVNVKVVVTCDPATSYKQLNVNLTQALPNGNIAAGGGQVTAVPCTGLPETVTVAAVASASGKAFKAGEAYASASFYSCLPYGQCLEVTAARKVTIVNP